MKDRIYLFTHTDLDGVGCSVVMHQYAKLTNKEIITHYCDYSNIEAVILKIIIGLESLADFYHNKLESACDIYITDISVSEETASKIDRLIRRCDGMNAHLIDHHQTAKDLDKYPWAKIDTGSLVCGTSLLYDTLPVVQNKTLDRFVSDVCLYDTWRFEKDGSNAEDLNILLYLLGEDRFQNLVCEKLDESLGQEPFIVSQYETYSDFVQHDKELRKKYCILREASVIDCIDSTHRFGIVFGEKYISALGSYVADKHPEFDYVAVINMPKSVSLRTGKDDINLGLEIAKPRGGGGHPKAAAFPLHHINADLISQMLDQKLKVCSFRAAF